MKRWVIAVCFAPLAVGAALAQQKKSVPPPPKSPDDGPATIVLMLEYSSLDQRWLESTANSWGDDFFPKLRQQDWLGLVSFNVAFAINADFTQDKDLIQKAVQHLAPASHTETNLFDAVLDTTNRLKRVPGRKIVLIVATGVDTFSKHSYKDTLDQLKQDGVMVYAIDTGLLVAAYTNTNQVRAADTTSGEQRLRGMADVTGGRIWVPALTDDLPMVFQEVVASLSGGVADGIADPVQKQNADESGEQITSATAQEKKAVPPPPKQVDDGPSLEITMKFIHDKLSSVGPMKYAIYLYDPVTADNSQLSVSSELSNLVGDASACRISFHSKVARGTDSSLASDVDAEFSLKDVQDITVMPEEQRLHVVRQREGSVQPPPTYKLEVTKVDPPVSVLMVRRTNAKEADNFFWFFDEELANRVAKAMVRAVELCGGGSKPEPF